MIWLLFLTACQITTNLENVADISRHAIKTTVSAAFAPDGTLWRLIPTKNAIYIDYSNDNGKTFSQPEQINPIAQKISAWPENPPAIAMSQSGRINVLYYADENQKSTSFFTYSDDNGKTFSQPVLVSDHAETAMHYMDKMLIDREDNIFLFWHDRRHELVDRQHGPGVLSLYYSVSNRPNSAFENRFISSAVCSCCRTATVFAPNDKPVVMVRMVFDNGIRDHALIRMNDRGEWSSPQRITYDNWKIEACPEHGPALAIDNTNRSHMAWFTLGESRQGIYYAQTDDYGLTVSEPMPLGNADRLPSHPDVTVLNNRVVLAWKEFDGDQAYLQIQESLDRGEHWSAPITRLTSSARNGHPDLITNGQDIFLSWLSEDKGYQFVKL